MENNTAVLETPEVQEVETPQGWDAIEGGPETEIAPATKTLDFTVVHGYLRGDHRCPFELHATGCKDLRGKLAKKLFSYNLYAPTREAALAEAESEHGAGSVWVQPCCTLKRMQAIGRA